MDVVEKNRTFLFIDELDSADRNPPTKCRAAKQQPALVTLGSGEDLEVIWLGMDSDVTESGADDDNQPGFHQIGRFNKFTLPSDGPQPVIQADALIFPSFKERSIISWDGQQFGSYSTLWEAEYTELMGPYWHPQAPFKPVVDDCGLVIGYFLAGADPLNLFMTEQGEIFFSALDDHGDPSYFRGLGAGKAQNILGQDLYLTSAGQVVGMNEQVYRLTAEEYDNMYHTKVPAGNKADILVDIDGYVVAINMYLDPPPPDPEKELKFWLGFILPTIPDQRCMGSGPEADTDECRMQQTMFFVDLMFLAIDIMSLGESAVLRKAALKLLMIGERARNAIRVARFAERAGELAIKGVRLGERAASLALRAPRLEFKFAKFFSWTERARFGKYFQESGMLAEHFRAAQRTVDEMAREGKEIYALFRPTNPESVKWIKKGFPAKGLELKVHTAPKTGIVTAAEVEFKDVFKEGYYVVNSKQADHLIAVREVGGKVEEMKIANPDWEVEFGQVIDPKSKKPFVGDYDLLGVIDTKAPTRNLANVSKDVKDFSDPLSNKFRKRFNAKLDRPRAMHGPQEKLIGKGGGFVEDEGAVLFRPGQEAAWLPDQTTVEQFFRDMGRPTVVGSHPRPGVKFRVGK